MHVNDVYNISLYLFTHAKVKEENRVSIQFSPILVTKPRLSLHGFSSFLFTQFY